MELTQQYLDQALKPVLDRLDHTATKTDLERFATKDDLEKAVGSIVSTISETVATPMEAHFAEFRAELALHEDVHTLKLEMRHLKEALHIS